MLVHLDALGDVCSVHGINVFSEEDMESRTKPLDEAVRVGWAKVCGLSGHFDGRECLK